jgi:hypothetical protein
MANRLMANRVYTGQKDVKIVNAVVTIGATGAPTLVVSKSWGIAAVTRVAAGKYRFALGYLRDGVTQVDVYREFQGAVINVFNLTADTAAVAPLCYVVNENSSTTGLIDVWFEATVAGGPIELANGEQVNVQFFFSDSSAP